MHNYIGDFGPYSLHSQLTLADKAAKAREFSLVACLWSGRHWGCSCSVAAALLASQRLHQSWELLNVKSQASCYFWRLPWGIQMLAPALSPSSLCCCFTLSHPAFSSEPNQGMNPLGRRWEGAKQLTLLCHISLHGSSRFRQAVWWLLSIRYLMLMFHVEGMGVCFLGV